MILTSYDFVSIPYYYCTHAHTHTHVQGDRLSRYGYQTQSSGSVKVLIYVLQQSRYVH